MLVAMVVNLIHILTFDMAANPLSLSQSYVTFG